MEKCSLVVPTGLSVPGLCTVMWYLGFINRLGSGHGSISTVLQGLHVVRQWCEVVGFCSPKILPDYLVPDPHTAKCILELANRRGGGLRDCSQRCESIKQLWYDIWEAHEYATVVPAPEDRACETAVAALISVGTMMAQI